VEFSPDNVMWTSVLQPINVFIPGWTEKSNAENYIARWVSPFDAQYIRISAVVNGTDGHDGNTQIDAIIASQSRLTTVPEPSSLALFGASTVVLIGFALRKRRARRN